MEHLSDTVQASREELFARVHGPGPWYIHGYKVDRVFGGSEEGGWWFDSGWPAEGVRSQGPFYDWREADEALQVLQIFLPRNKSRYSVIGTPDLEFAVQSQRCPDEFWYNYPGQREYPRYE